MLARAASNNRRQRIRTPQTLFVNSICNRIVNTYSLY